MPLPMEIERLPAFTDNYIFLLYDPQRQIAAVVDPRRPDACVAPVTGVGCPAGGNF